MKPKALLSFLLLCFFLIISRVYAQDVIVKGVLVDPSTKNRITYADITNWRTKVTVQSNSMGFFQVLGKDGDTLIIQGQGYSPLNIPASTKAEMLIHLRQDITNIRQVVIDGNATKTELDDMKQSYKDKGSHYSGKPPFLAFLFQPLTAIYELVGRTPRNARRFGNFYNKELEQMEVEKYFNEPLIVQETGLNGKQLADYMISFRPGYNLVKKWTRYDAVAYISKTYKIYKADPARYNTELPPLPKLEGIK